MITRKTFQIVIVVLFSLSLFSTGAVANSGCEKACCMTVVKYDHGQVAGTNTASMSHGCCSKTNDIPCELEKGKDYKIIDANILNTRLEDDHTFIVIITNHYPYNNYSSNHFSQELFTEASARSAPIYLQNLSLIC